MKNKAIKKAIDELSVKIREEERKGMTNDEFLKGALQGMKYAKIILQKHEKEKGYE